MKNVVGRLTVGKCFDIKETVSPVHPQDRGGAWDGDVRDDSLPQFCGIIRAAVGQVGKFGAEYACGCSFVGMVASKMGAIAAVEEFGANVYQPIMKMSDTITRKAVSTFEISSIWINGQLSAVRMISDPGANEMSRRRLR